MKQLGNLAVVCARRENIILQIQNGCVSILIGSGADQAVLLAAWEDDEKISDIIRELNFGKYAESPKEVAKHGE